MGASLRLRARLVLNIWNETLNKREIGGAIPSHARWRSKHMENQDNMFAGTKDDSTKVCQSLRNVPLPCDATPAK